MTTERVPRSSSAGRIAAVAHCSAEMYGADRQLRESVAALVGGGWRAIVFLPERGPLFEALREDDVDVRLVPFPVLRKSDLSIRGLWRLLSTVPRTVVAVRRILISEGVGVLYVNTLTLPWWVLGGWLSRTPVVSHVHEAEAEAGSLVRGALVAPLHLASVVIVNSRAARLAITTLLPRLDRRIRLVYNGVSARHESTPKPHLAQGARRLALVGRLSPRKGTDVAIEALAVLSARGHDVSLDLCGSSFPGYEWFADELHERAGRPDLRGRITFHGYVSDIDAILARADVVLVPSRVEPFGNAAVEAQLACRPVVASRVQGLQEIIDHGETGVLVPPDDPDALATAVERLLGDPEHADRIAEAGRDAALTRFDMRRYHSEILSVVEHAWVRGPSSGPRSTLRTCRGSAPTSVTERGEGWRGAYAGVDKARRAMSRKDGPLVRAAERVARQRHSSS